MNVYVGEEQERYAAEVCLRTAYRRLLDNDVDQAVHRAEESLRSLRALQEIKKPTDIGVSRQMISR